ncbi:hypothetical protein Tco_0298747 [Tanacetum coccineum]
MATPIDFTKFAMNRLKLVKITKIDLVGLVCKLLTGTCKSNIELEYNMDQCYNALTDKLNWTNPEDMKLGKQIYYISYQDKGCEISSVVSVKVDKRLGYGYLDEIMVRRANQKLHKLKEGDFPKLHLNDIEDMLLL